MKDKHSIPLAPGITGEAPKARRAIKPLQSRKCTRVGGAKEGVTGTFLEFWLAKEELSPETKFRDRVGCSGAGPGLAGRSLGEVEWASFRTEVSRGGLH